MFSSQIYCVTFVNHRCTGGFTYFTLHFIHATFCIEPRSDNARSFDWPVIIRAVNTVDAMTATIEPVDWPILMKITDRILKEVKNVNRVCYDMSPKPNATIEWE